MGMKEDFFIKLWEIYLEVLNTNEDYMVKYQFLGFKDEVLRK